MTLNDYLSGITGADRDAVEAAKKRNDGLLKPLGSLGRLETMAVKMAGITGKVLNTAESAACWCLRRTTASSRRAWPARPRR